MRHATILAAILAFVPLASATAQVPVRPGARVRVTYTPTCPPQTVCAGFRDRLKRIGTVVSWDGDTLHLDAKGRTSSQVYALNVPRSSIIRLDVSWGQKSNGGLGTAIGLLAGVALGGLFGLAIFEEPEPCKGLLCIEFGPENKSEAFWFGAMVGGLLGGTLGFLASFGSDVWKEVPLDRLRVSLGPQRDGRFGLGLSGRF